MIEKFIIIKTKWLTITDLDLYLVLVIAGILVAIVSPNYIGLQQKAKAAAVKGNMNTIQIASESYATDTGGVYPDRLEDLLPYFPGGYGWHGGEPGSSPEIIFLHEKDEWLKYRSTPVANLPTLKPRQAIYFGGKTTYGVMQADDTGHIISGLNGYALVLSNE